MLRFMIDWSPSKREEFLFRLARVARAVDVEGSERSGISMAETMAESIEEYRQMVDVMVMLGNLPPSARFEVIDQVQRTLAG